jgi:hypothetical protein
MVLLAEFSQQKGSDCFCIYIASFFYLMSTLLDRRKLGLKNRGSHSPNDFHDLFGFLPITAAC